MVISNRYDSNWTFWNRKSVQYLKQHHFVLVKSMLPETLIRQTTVSLECFFLLTKIIKIETHSYPGKNPFPAPHVGDLDEDSGSQFLALSSLSPGCCTH